MKTLSKVMLCAAGWFSLHSVNATPITYNMFFQVQVVESRHSPGSPYYPPLFKSTPSVGDVFQGFFTLEDAILATDGLLNPVPLDAFRLEIAGLVWDKNVPSAFAGFRGPSLSMPSPQFLIAGGEITEIPGGVYGHSDIPFVDFWLGGNWQSVDAESSLLRGTYRLERLEVESIPEPTSMLFISMGLLGIAALGWKRKPIPSGQGFL